MPGLLRGVIAVPDFPCTRRNPCTHRMLGNNLFQEKARSSIEKSWIATTALVIVITL